MVETLYRCTNEDRRRAIRSYRDAEGLPLLNGIDFVEVSPDRRSLRVLFIHPIANRQIALDQVQITPQPQQNRSVAIAVESVSISDQMLTVRVSRPGDSSPYRLRLVNSSRDLTPPIGFDPQLSQVDFYFQTGDRSEFDCQRSSPTSEITLPPPTIDYLAKDYHSFRQLMLDRLAVTMPQWKERNPSDLGVLLVELVAYSADHLSYYQDAVGTEAYLGTARKRMSIRRHARLLNYRMHDGCNARAWITLMVEESANDQTLPGPNAKTLQPGTCFLTRVPPLKDKPIFTDDRDLETAMNLGAQVFETLHDRVLHADLNTIEIYTWGDRAYSLSQGATTATLNDNSGTLQRLLKPGDALIFEEVKGPKTGNPVDADLTRRHVVRLTQITVTHDPLFNINVLEIEWGLEDTLSFPFVVSEIIGDQSVENISVVRGNVVLADHGYTVDEADRVLDPVPESGLYRPRLKAGPLTQQGFQRDRTGKFVLFDKTSPASAASVYDWKVQDARPAIVLQRGEELWRPQSDLLNSDRFAQEFVVETEESGRAYLRFGDNVLGKRPEAGMSLTAIYRVGNGRSGNVGAEAIAHLFLPNSPLEGAIQAVRNPLPAQGGLDPEPLEQVRLYAPQAFRTLQRAVTEADYAEMAQRFPGVRKALATRRWTGSWYTMFLTVDRAGGLPVDAEFRDALREFLEPFRLSGHDIEIESPRFVPLEIALTVQIHADYFQSEVKQALLDTFSDRVLPNRLGFFHPDRFTFGQPVYLSQVIATAMQVVGVAAIDIQKTRFQRLGIPSQQALETGEITLDRLEIAQLENNPNQPERGRFEVDLVGGIVG